MCDDVKVSSLCVKVSSQRERRGVVLSSRKKEGQVMRLLLLSASLLTIESLHPEPGILGPPKPLRSLRVGDRVKAFRGAIVAGGERRNFTIERVSEIPDIFLLRNVISLEECTQLMASAKIAGLNEAETVSLEHSSVARRKCSVAWLAESALGKTIGSLLLTTEVKSEAGAGFEDLQVLRYESSGQYLLHHDGSPRCLTVIYYLNGVAGTYFPLASTKGHFEAVSHGEEDIPRNREAALLKSDKRSPRLVGLLVDSDNDDSSTEASGTVVNVKQGDAVAFYNYHNDGTGELDWRAIHSGLPSDQIKWIANHWYHAGCLKL